MKVFVTKYVLTEGIQEVDVIDRGDGVVSKGEPGRMSTIYYHGEGRQWHRTAEGAKKKAEEMRLRKIASVKKSLEKLEKLRF